MDFINIAGIALGLAMDAFAVAIASSITLGSVSPRQVFRLAFHFGLFQAMMPVLGWLAGKSVADVFGKWDHWVAFGLLAFIGIRAIHAALTDDPEEEAPDPTRGISLVMLSVATSIDALAVGLSFAMLHVRIWYPALVIGIVAATMTTLGMLLGTRLGSRFGRNTEIGGGLILIIIGLNILIQHLRE
ncbi:MAG: manganese efflux pump MntP family protein [Armatimonadota bacterium]